MIRTGALSRAIVAHRGGSCEHAENSLPAFEAASRSGVDAVEMDVHISSDGEPFILHDSELDQTTSGSGPVNAMTAAELERITVLPDAGPLPRLGDVLDLFGDTKMDLLVEVKHHRDRSPYEGIEMAIADCIREHRIAERVIAIGFQTGALVSIARMVPGVRTCQSYSRIFERDPRSDEDILADLTGKGFWGIMAFAYEVTPAFVSLVRDSGLALGVWTPNGPARLAYWLSQPVDFVITDQPGLAMELRGPGVAESP